MIFFPFVYNVTDVLFNVNARGSLVGGNGVTVGGVGSITGVASGVEFGASVAAGVGTVGVGTCVGVVVGATIGVAVGVGVGTCVGVVVGATVVARPPKALAIYSCRFSNGSASMSVHPYSSPSRIYIQSPDYIGFAPR